jgi:tRNA (Thr-GGU) A37 N-methylase
MTLSRILRVEDNIIEIEWTDALENTPIIDIKPFIRTIDCTEDSKVPAWLENNDWVKKPSKGMQKRRPGASEADKDSVGVILRG